MRGTKHDASQHQRRGIRSRLIASVAAVAMLATSIAAGTAVAADIDETDPTQQNTIVEQAQQGTENAGDQTGEQNTESEGDQTDQPQESDGAETETESDNTTEADSTEETGSKTDADKTDGNQSVEKQSAAVPAPQAAESRASTHKNVPNIIENVESTNDKIHVNLFDYDKGTQNAGGVNYERAGNGYTKRSFLFGESGGINGWTQENGGVRQGIVAGDLTKSGYPQLASQYGGADLGYLFNPDGQTTGVELKGTDVNGLFRQDEDGYYYYDSADNFAKFDKDSNSFKLYESGRFNNFDAITGAVGHGAFLPFNDLKSTGDNYIDSGDTFNGLHGYRLEGDNLTGDNTDKSSVNYFFGMTVSADFYMPDGRQVDDKDMVFEFEGDDDVWVFVDGKLVLDLGGIHDNYSGSINFTSGEVTVTDDNHAGKQRSLTDIFGSLDSLENKTHGLKVFYLERGAGGSNCKFRFNLPAVPTSGEDLSVAKAVSGDVDSDATYTMNVLIDGTNPYMGKYQLYTLSGQKVGEERTANGGVIVMKAGQYATLMDPSIKKDTQYVVREVADSARGFQVTATGNGTGDITMSSQPDGSAQSDMLTVSKDSFVTVVNTKPLGEPDHSKKIGDNGNGTYTLALDVIGKNSEETQVTTIPLDEGIQSSITTGASYSNVAIVDELSRWAQVVYPDGFAENATLTVEKPSGYDGEGNVTGWTTVDPSDAGYPNGYRIKYTPASGDDTTTGTVRVDFPEEYKLQNGWRYTLKFDVKPTDQAYSDYADNTGKYPTDQSTDSRQTEGDEGTDLYTDETNTPECGVRNTSDGKPGFHSNKNAYVEYTSAGNTDKTFYDHPVLQVDVTPVTIGSEFGLQEKKTVIGDSAGKGEFDFTVTATGDNAKAAAELAGWAQCSDDQSDRCYVMSDKGAVYSFSNPKSITQGEPAVVRSAGEEGGVKFTPDMAGKTFTYVYEESEVLPANWYNQSEFPVWTVTATVDFTGNKKALQVTVNVYHDDSASGNPADTYVYTGGNQQPTHTGSSSEDVPTVSFTNTYVARVSSLPLTGGSSTARTLLLTGGGVLLVAGAAWLLARRRQA